MREASALYRLLGDEARLRLLRVLARERLNVTELTGVLGLAQSGVSRHLGLLKDAGLVGEERDGGFSYYRLSPALDGGDAALTTMLRAQFEAAAMDPSVRADDARLCLAVVRTALNAWYGQIAGQIGLLITVIIIIRILPEGVSGWLARRER